MKTIFKVLIGVFLAGVLLIGGCTALLGAGASEVSKEIEADQKRNAITNTQARNTKLGASRRAVERRLGPPKSDQESSNDGLGDDSCIYYNLKGGEALDSWQFCFAGAGKSGKLRSKNRL